VPDCPPGSYANATTLTCAVCPLDSYCEGGPQPGGGNIVACTPPAFTLSTNSSSPGECQTCAAGSPPSCTVPTCAPGYYAPTTTSACTACTVGYTCPGGPQATPQRTQCTNGLTTLTATASATAECVRVCPAGQYAPSPTAPCTVCGTPFYCPGGSQADGPLRNPCPLTPPPGYTTLTNTAESQADCVIVCAPGYYSTSPYIGACVECGVGSYCGGGPQASPVRADCTTGLTTLNATAATSAECFAYECDPGTLPINPAVPPLNQTMCEVKVCDPCGATAPDLYMTGKLGVYVSPDWTNTTAANTATTLCTFDPLDPTLCSQRSTSARAACTTNDIAIDAAGDIYVLGRTGGTYATSGWVIRIDPASTVPPGQPCKYEVLLSGIEPYAGLGAAPNSNLLYATGSNSVLTLKIETDGTLSTAGQLAVPNFTGAGDITAAPDGKGMRERWRETDGAVVQ